MIDFDSITKFDSAGKDFEMVEFSWAVTNYCNYNCSYCYAKTFMKNSLDQDTGYRLILQKLKMCQITFDITLVGGEPTRHPELQFIIETLDKIDNCRVLEVYTNFTKPIDYYYNWRYIKKLSLKLSYHPEYHKIFLKKLERAIKEKKTNFLVLVNLSPSDEYWCNTEKILKLCKTNNVDFEINYLLDTESKKIDYSEKFYKTFDPFITDNMNENVEHAINDTVYNIPESKIYKLGLSYEGMICIPRMFRIESNGDFVNSCSRRKLPLIVKKEDVAQEYLCPHKSCSCSAMLPFRKVRV